MKIVADANIPLLAEAFGPLGEVVALPADRITPSVLRDADALLVRSVTRVNEALLAASPVKFVATATIGFDHVDLGYLASRGIALASAQGSNARSVAEYVLAALAVLAKRGGYPMTRQVLGIVGCGNVGGRLARMAEAIGMKVLRNDPPLARQTGDPRYVPLDALADADVVTFHVPLERGGPDPTYHMINEALLARLKRGATLINTSRGAVAETAALKAAIADGRLGRVILDVWEKEPNIDVELLGRVDLATPHIAGYSYDGKVNGTRMVLEALCRHFGLRREWDPSPLMPPPANPRVSLPAGISIDEAMYASSHAAYDVEVDDRRLRAIASEPPENRAKLFDGLRKNYPVRREFPETTVEMAEPSAAVKTALEALGFRIRKST
jgi:erythronate-4-phosphate dehydrogenase